MSSTLSITYQGNLDLSLYAHTLDIPADFKFPPGMKKPLTEYDTALQEYDVALLAAEESRVQLAQAGEKDKAALIASFDAGTADPGTPHAVAAEREAAVADEKVRHCARKLATAAETVTELLTEHREAVLQAALAHERSLIDAISTKWEQVAALVSQIDVMEHELGTRANFALHALGERPRIERDLQQWALPAVRYRTNSAALDHINIIEATVAGAARPDEQTAE